MQRSRVLQRLVAPSHRWGGTGSTSAFLSSSLPIRLRGCAAVSNATRVAAATLLSTTSPCVALRYASTVAAASPTLGATATSMARTPADVVACLARSPTAPAAGVFRPLSSSANSGAQSATSLVLHTGFSEDTASNAAIAQAPSFEVLSALDFQALMAEALESVPAEHSAQSAAESALVEAEEAGMATLLARRADREAKPCGPHSEALPRLPPVVRLTARELGASVNHNHTTRELQRLIRDVDRELAPLLAVKAPIDHYAYKRYYPLLKYTCLAVLVAQFGIFFNWIFFVFDWNLVEPITYFIGYTGVFCSLVYHYIRCDVAPEEQFTWRDAFVFLAGRKARSLYAAKGLDTARLGELERTRRAAVVALAKYQ